MPEYSPILAILTGILEVAAGVYALVGPGRKPVLRPVAIILFLLAGYQFAEVAVCSNPAALAYSRLAYVIIAWLPPYALRLAVALDEGRGKLLRTAALVYYVAAAAMSLWILADHGVITRSVCDLITARYFQATTFAVVYGLFYQSALLWIVFGSGVAMVRAGDAVARKHLASLQLGILGFMFPALAVRVLVPRPGDILPSAMCHFALILAASFVALVVRERRLAGRLASA
jgi:hypothetical protein